jgi:DNA end-binding protein Ku
VAKLVIRERQHLCAVLPDGPALLAYTLRWPYQLRGSSDLEFPGEDLADLGVSSQETKMAEMLVEAMAAPWEPEQYHDTYHEDLLRVIEAKVANAGKTIAAAPEPTPPKTREAEVVDIMALLKRSVEQQKKRPAADGAGAESGARAADRAKAKAAG